MADVSLMLKEFSGTQRLTVTSEKGEKLAEISYEYAPADRQQAFISDVLAYRQFSPHVVEIAVPEAVVAAAAPLKPKATILSIASAPSSVSLGTKPVTVDLQPVDLSSFKKNFNSCISDQFQDVIKHMAIQFEGMTTTEHTFRLAADLVAKDTNGNEKSYQLGPVSFFGAGRNLITSPLTDNKPLTQALPIPRDSIIEVGQLILAGQKISLRLRPSCSVNKENIAAIDKITISFKFTQ
ncbi:hypothetical protein [Vibrio variabilis]|uniref:hypothetical protein n=1 Tax=Vibrio variabilis TaxID=990271 RepID=UPI0013A68F45|nr:hypothetical protein [Vibrio variabilis]